jgi:mRNA-degrading endonuclease RelE of RelBE toxin-antitoxin system
MAGDPFAGDVVKLEGGADRWWRRVGNYRIFFVADTDARTVDVSPIVRRTSATY